MARKTNKQVEYLVFKCENSQCLEKNLLTVRACLSSLSSLLDCCLLFEEKKIFPNDDQILFTFNLSNQCIRKVLCFSPKKRMRVQAIIRSQGKIIVFSFSSRLYA